MANGAGEKTTLGVIVGNRGFFPKHLVDEGHAEIRSVLEAAGIDYVILSPQDTRHGAVESHEEAEKCGRLFKKNADRINGVLVTLPNFGDERAIADTMKESGLHVPILVQATPDDIKKMTIKDRRDSFCGKMSACNNLGQYGFKYSLTGLHTVSPSSAEFRDDLYQFAAVCRIVDGLKHARMLALGARPEAFKTVRYSEKILQDKGIDVTTMDLFDFFGLVGKLKKGDEAVAAKLAAIKGYVPTKSVPEEALVKMAKVGACLDNLIKSGKYDATAVQCWTAIEDYFGIVPCGVMSMLSEALMPSACEVDIPGAVGMLAMRYATGRPSALLDWNNNYGNNPNRCVLFHCSNIPKSFFADAKMDYQEIIAGTVGKDNAMGTCVGRIRQNPFTYARVDTDDINGRVIAYTGSGRFLSKKEAPLKSFGGIGAAEIEDLQGLLKVMCEEGFAHHVAANVNPQARLVASAVAEAFGKYMGWDVLHTN